MQLIIVESPSKAKTIEKYLKGKYKVDASEGHVRDLPEKRLGVNVSDNFEPNYVVTADKKQTIKRLTEKTAKADKVYLATDPDREGEAISWHLMEVLKLEGKAQRIVFNEVSEKAIKKALEEPREINKNLVDSQQARRVLDRLVGYKLSPLLCKRIQDGLSAGRVQSVTLRLIVDREREIRAFKPQEFWNVVATLKGSTPPQFKALMVELKGKKFKPATKEEADKVLETVSKGEYVVKEVKKSVVKSHPLPPFTTSTMQQDAANKLNMTSPMIMSVAQHLYEGVETPKGHLALVTYIRTDSVRVSTDAQMAARAYIEQNFGKEYVPNSLNVYKSKNKSQDAHEAIRPIDITVTPESLKGVLDKNHYNLYKLIYDRFLASQMSDAVYNQVKVTVENSGYAFKTSGKTVKFKGFTAVYDDYRKDEEDGEESKNLPTLTKGEILKEVKVEGEQKFTHPPVRFTDASLVKIMEEKGIGRPSTYSSIISVLTKRKYTTKEGKFLVPTEIAFRITDMLVKYFSDIMDVGFTANMEDKLDNIENGGKDWRKLIGDFYPPFADQLSKAMRDGDEMTEFVCEKCGAPMLRKTGRFGKYLACSNYPECSNIKSENVEESEEICEKCGSVMIYKTGKFGKFLACPNYPKCTNIKALNEEKSTEKCEKCGGETVVKQGKFGKYLYCKECKNTKSLAEDAGICPVCGKPTRKMASKSGKVFYGCSNYPECSFMSWDMPNGELCPKCGKHLVYSKDGKSVRCSDKDCNYSLKGKNAK
ncbi:MAG: type I DNA topoisomerase [Clostridiales bacterium]|nr:type I DNA topoisomerase [Clostridiales bacterium]